MSVVTAAVASWPALIQETRLLYSTFLLSCQNSGPLLSCTNATTVRCCCLMPTCLFDNWYCINWPMFVKIPLALWISMSTLRLHESLRFTILNDKFLRHHSKLPTLRLTKSLGYLWIYLLLRDLTISPSHLLNLSAPGAYHEIVISWLPFELVLEWFVLALAMHIYTNI